MTRRSGVGGSIDEPFERAATSRRRGVTASEPESNPRCAFCRRAMPAPTGVGRPRTYCRRSCRQRAFEQRRRVTEQSWGDDRVVRMSEELAAAGDRLAHVADVLDEVRIDLADEIDVPVHEVLERLAAALR
jgi:hypothetical protein